MGLHERDGWREPPSGGGNTTAVVRPPTSTGRHLAFLAAWLVLMATLYLAFDHWIAPPEPQVTASGDLRIPRSRDGHFYVDGRINGRAVRFLVDTGASTVVVSDEFARQAGLSGGTPTTFHTANGVVQGRIVPRVPVSVGPLEVSAVHVGVGLVGARADRALLGQNFLARFHVSISREEMVIRQP